MSRPLVAVVGRPNVGKSTLVNRVVGRREAIVESQPGVTRDRKILPAEWAGREFDLMDTGGWTAGGGALDSSVSAQAERAIAAAAAVIMVVDTTTGLTEEDDRVAAMLRRTKAPVVVAANKVDDAARESDAWAFTRLGLGDPMPVSALHGRGTGDFLDAVVALLPAPSELSTDASVPAFVVTSDGADGPEGVLAERPESLVEGSAPSAPSAPLAPSVPAVAIAGRPNVGKSTLFNRLVGEERSIVHDEAGTTRDAVDTRVSTPDGDLLFIDTAGMRRRAKEAEGAEYYSMVRALRAIDRADASLLVIDATEGVTRQDQRLAERIDAAGSPVVVVLNKWDLATTEQRAATRAQVADRLAFCAYAPVVAVSAKTGLAVHKLLPALRNSIDAYRRRVPTAELNRVIAAAQAAHRSPGGRVLYATQGATDPPTFVLFSTRPVPPGYLRYLERSIREHFSLGPTPVVFRVRRRAE